MKKKLSNLLFICFLFAVLFILTPFKTINSFSTGDIVSYRIQEGNYCGIPNEERNTSASGQPALYKNEIIQSTCVGTPPYGRRIASVEITGSGGCMANDCTTIYSWNEPMKCVTLKYRKITNYRGGAYEEVFKRFEKQECKTCYQEIEDGDPSDILNERLVLKNECLQHKNKGCVDPCQRFPTCPLFKCEIIDPDKVGFKVGYDCVEDTAVTTAAIPMAGGSTAIPKSGAECCNLIDRDPPFTWCPADKTEGCCPPKWVCEPDGVKKTKKAVCCAPNQTFVKSVKNYCNNDRCLPEKPKLCKGTLYNACCKEGQPCGTFKVKKGFIPLGTVGYCKIADDNGVCPPETVDDCSGLCCKSGQECKTKNGISKCVPDSPSDCDTANGETYCPGKDAFEEVKRCCPDGEACLNQPNGYPYCYLEQKKAALIDGT